MKVSWFTGKSSGYLARHPLEARRIYTDRLSEVFDVVVPGESLPIRISLSRDEVLGEVGFWRETDRKSADYGLLYGEVWER